jgi:hypothetical protein
VGVALDDGETEIGAIVARIYPELAPTLHGIAARNILAHLIKLEREGRSIPRSILGHASPG